MNFAAAALLSLTLISAEPRNESYFKITVVDAETGRGVPLIELRTTNNLTYYTDSAGVVAFHEPGWMDQPVFFYVSGHGYELPPDGFGFRGQRLMTESGGSATIKIKRINIAERLYRITGSGIYVDSQRVGGEVPFQADPMNAQVVGSDSVQAAVLNDQIYWFWGDTNRPSYPLGNFDVTAATSHPPEKGGLDPMAGVQLKYIVGPDGFARSVCKMPGTGPTWLDGIAVVKDDQNRERLFGHYLKVKPPLTVYEEGMAEFMPDKQAFEPRYIFPKGSVIPSGHSFVYSEQGTDYICFAKPFSLVRVRATTEAILDREQFEAFSCLKSGSSATDLAVEKNDQGQAVYGWKRNTPPITLELQQKLLASGKLTPEDCLYKVRDVTTGKRVRIHHGSINWNEFRKRWILIASEIGGTSHLGEVWYAESDRPMGPWAYARKIVTHEKQSFYNPRHHPFFNQQDGRVLFFEGTYTNSFSGNNAQTPRYEYNQVMYRLNLGDDRLVLPIPIRSRTSGGDVRLVREADPNVPPTFRDIVFFAADREFADSLPVFANKAGDGFELSVKNRPQKSAGPLFYAFRPDGEQPKGTVPLFEYVAPNGKKKYIPGDERVSGFERAEKPLCYVWPTL